MEYLIDIRDKKIIDFWEGIKQNGRFFSRLSDVRKFKKSIDKLRGYKKGDTKIVEVKIKEVKKKG